MRTTLDYLPKYLNYAAAATGTGVQDTVTGLRISTGTNTGDFVELTATQAAQLSANGVAANILTAGTGQTDGAYTANASYGPATLSYTILGGLLTSVSVSKSNGIYTPAYVTANGGSAPTFTIAAGGTPGTVQGVLTQLDSGIYQRVKLTAGLAAVPVGTSLFWNPTDTTSPYAVTNVPAALTSNGGDFAGICVDPTFGTTSNGTQLTHAWIQCTGRTQAVLSGAGAIGGGIGFPVTTTNQFVVATTTNPTYVGTQLTAATGAAGIAKVRLVIPQTKY